MTTRWRITRHLFPVLLFLFLPTMLFAHGIDVESIIENVQIGSGKNMQTYLLMNSRLNEHQWYCARLTPELVEFGEGKNAEPDLTLIRFQKVDPKNPEKLNEGGILQFTFAIGPDQSSLLALRKKLPKSADQRLARIDPLPLSGLEMNIFDPRGKKIALTATAPQGIASDYSSQYARFSALFSTIDADLAESLLNGANGLGFELNYRFAVLSEQKKISIKVDFDRLASRDKNKSDNAIAESDRTDIDAAMLSYLKRQATNPRVAQRLRSSADRAKKDIEQTQPVQPANPRDYGKKDTDGKEAPKISDLLQNVSLTHRSRSQKVAAARGILSLAKYPEEIRKKRLISDISYDNWKRAWLLMPSIGEIPDLTIEKVTLKATLSDKSHTYTSRSYEWTPEKRWLDEHKAPSAIADFSLKDLLAAGVDSLSEARFKLEYSIFAAGSPPVTGSDILPVITGDTPVAAPMELADILMFDFSNLYWDAPDNDKQRLVKVELNVVDDKRRISRFISPARRSNSVTIYPEQTPVLLTRGNFARPGVVKVTVFFHTADGKKIPWDFNGMNLSETFSGSYITFLDNDWQIEK